MAGFALGAQALLLLWAAFARGQAAASARRRVGQWWVSGRTPEGEQRHYLLRVV